MIEIRDGALVFFGCLGQLGLLGIERGRGLFELGGELLEFMFPLAALRFEGFDAGEGFGELVFDGLHDRVRNRPGHRVNFAGVQTAQAGENGVPVLGGPSEVVALCLAGTEGLALHRLVRDLPAAGEHGGTEVGEDFLHLSLEQLALFVGERRAGRADALELAGGEHLHVKSRLPVGLGTVEEGDDHADRSDPRAGRGVDGVGLGGDPVGRTAHESAGEGVDELLPRCVRHRLGQFGRAVHGSARRIDVEQDGLDILVLHRLADCVDRVLGIHRTKEPAFDQAGTPDQRAVQAHDPDAFLDVEERMRGRVVLEQLAVPEGGGPGGKVIQRLRRDEPGLAGSDRVERRHASLPLSTGGRSPAGFQSSSTGTPYFSAASRIIRTSRARRSISSPKSAPSSS